MTPGPQPGSCGFESRRGYLFIWSWGSMATPPASGAGDRRFDSCRPDLCAPTRGRGAAVLASLMSSRPWVRIPPAPFGGRSSDEQSARLSSERPPVRVRSSPLDGGCGVDGSTRGCEPRRRRFEPGRPPSSFHADAEHRRAQQAVTLSLPAVVVRLHPSAPSRGCSSIGRAPRLQRGRCRFDSDRLHLASVVSTASTRPS